MNRDSLPKTASELARKLQSLKQKRRKRKRKINDTDSKIRGHLKPSDRDLILRKTGGRCHICGGKIKGNWQADHVLARSVGGKPTIENYLPAHKLCNHYRWDYSAGEFQYILRIGVWTCTKIRKQSKIGLEVAKGFVAHERALLTRRMRS
jgi:5-methylcytosine-specific restriction endonuclease McrA